ncbi:hypothetical protein J3L18_12380 [Mucilaginibacter gossypii]|uniref:hypothetical protein n=1 Tax=Mucilaginibacter gossypii TaxID=551996 RepID=UPI000DCDF207|nr:MULTISPECIES: hypothetical protein [Mucilaginibacter]QTE39805.1 hypothetical protein J3L18_12380 [Mucilaginibacter gossypii]RAV54183.1 hypothetical protein DIU36_21415 [Mucilaginibacter rubeus]
MKTIYLFAIAMVIALNGFAQGCSDAGFCSLGVLKNNIEDTVGTLPKKNAIDFGINYGLGEQNTSTINTYVQYQVNLNNHFSFQSKLTATYATGFLGHAFNIGDVYGTLNYTPRLNSANSLNFIGGIKIPVSTGNDKNNEGKPLPLDYQASIGTYDAIAGVNYIVNRTWEFDAAVQLPVIQINKSTYFPDEYNDPRALEFAPTNNFRRKSDLLGRIGYYIHLPQSSLTLKPSLSAVYHIGDDTYENKFGYKTSIDGSQGLTLNGSIVATKTFKNANRFEIVVGTPFIVRKIRPDGLTRSGVINFQYTIAF